VVLILIVILILIHSYTSICVINRETQLGNNTDSLHSPIIIFNLLFCLINLLQGVEV